MKYSRKIKFLGRIKQWFVKQYRKNKNTYVIKDKHSNQYIDTIYAKTSNQVMKIFSRRLRKGKHSLYKRYNGIGIIIENKDWYKSLEE